VVFKKESTSLANIRILIVNLGAFAANTILRVSLDGIINPSGTLTGQIPIHL
jgi:hypothetical protein